MKVSIRWGSVWLLASFTQVAEIEVKAVIVVNKIAVLNTELIVTFYW